MGSQDNSDTLGVDLAGVKLDADEEQLWDWQVRRCYNDSSSLVRVDAMQYILSGQRNLPRPQILCHRKDPRVMIFYILQRQLPMESLGADTSMGLGTKRRWEVPTSPL